MEKERFGKLDLVIMQNSELTPNDKIVFAALRMYENPKTKQCNPSQEQLAEAIGSSRSSIQRGLKNLIHFGFVKLLDGKGKRAKYALSIDPPRVNVLIQNDSTNGSSIDPPRVNNGPTTGQCLYNDVKDNKKTNKRPDFSELHFSARKLWPSITDQKYAAGDLTNLAKEFGKEIVSNALRNLADTKRTVKKPVPYMRTMLTSEPASKPMSKTNVDEMDAWQRQAHDSLPSTILQNRAADYEPFSEAT